jgi:arylsulfatase A-like enzyme
MKQAHEFKPAMNRLSLPGLQLRARLSALWLSALLLVPSLGLPCGQLAAAPRPSILICVADDWGYGHAGVYGDPVVRTPHFDRVAREGAVFTRAHCAAASCTPSRAAMLTGRWPHQLEEGGNLWSTLPAKFAAYPDLLEKAGYAVGCEGKGWGPGDFKAGGRARNPAGPPVKFEHFLAGVKGDQPFCFWFGSQDPHRPYPAGSGAAAGLKAADVRLPAAWPDAPEIRGDVLDYLLEVQRFDARVGAILAALEKSGRLDSTLVVVTSDNGMPFPRGKATCYDLGTRMPLAMRWPEKIKAGTTIDSLVSQVAFAPTFLEAAGLTAPPEMAEKSLLPLLAGTAKGADRVFTERERHADVRRDHASYPVRAVRTEKWLYLRNFRPERWPAGDPEMVFAVGEFGDVDPGPTKDSILALRDDPARARYFRLNFDRRPAEELYDAENDPHQLHNLADDPVHRATRLELRAALDQWMRTTGDPRAARDDDRWDRYPYHGKPGRDMAPQKSVAP